MAQSTVLYLLDYTELGGGETSFLALIDCLARTAPNLHPVVVLPGPGAVAERLRALNVETHLIPFPRRLRLGPLPWFSPLAARRIGRLIDRVRPALVHANNFFGMLYSGPAARRRHVPLVWTCHGWFDIDTRLKAWAARRYAARVTCVSEAVRQEAARRLGAAPPTLTDYLGITPFAKTETPTSRAALRAAVRAEFGVAEAAPLIAVVGRFQPIKGHALLLDALPEIIRHVPGLQVWLIGEALNEEEKTHKRLIERRLAEEGLASRVRFLGFRADARRLLRGLDALVIPSARESFSMAAVEGLEAAIPVVGPDGWGPREIIAAPQTGLHFKSGDAADLAAQVVAALRREGAGAAFDPQAGPPRAIEHFSIEAHLKRTLAMYQSVVPNAFGEQNLTAKTPG